MSVNEIPGASGQPPKQSSEPSWTTMQYFVETTPKVDYGMKPGNPLQDTSPVVFGNKGYGEHGDANSTNNSLPGPMTPTANDLNGGRDMFKGGGVG